MNKTDPVVRKKVSIGSKKPKSARPVLMLTEHQKANLLYKLFGHDDLNTVFQKNINPVTVAKLSAVSNRLRKKLPSIKLEYFANSSKFKTSFEEDLSKISVSSKSIEDLNKHIEPIKENFTMACGRVIGRGTNMNVNVAEIHENYKFRIKPLFAELCKIYLTLFKKSQDIVYLIKVTDVLTLMKKVITNGIHTAFRYIPHHGADYDNLNAGVNNDLPKYSILEYEYFKFLLVNLLIQKNSKKEIKNIPSIILNLNNLYFLDYYSVTASKISKHYNCLRSLIKLFNNMSKLDSEECIEILFNDKCLKLELKPGYNISLL